MLQENTTKCTKYISGVCVPEEKQAAVTDIINISQIKRATISHEMNKVVLIMMSASICFRYLPAPAVNQSHKSDMLRPR